MPTFIKLLSVAIIGTLLTLMAACGARSAPAAQQKAGDSASSTNDAESRTPATLLRPSQKGRIELPGGGYYDLPKFGKFIEGGIEITSPRAGAVVAPGQTLEVALEPRKGFKPQRALVACKYDTAHIEKPPFKGTIDVPADAIGQFTLRVLAFDAENNVAGSDDVNVLVKVSAGLANLVIDPKEEFAFDFSPTCHVYVFGDYEDGVRRRLNDAGVPIEFRSENPQIAVVDAKGVVTGVSVGTAIIKAKVGQHEAQMTMHVESVP